MTQKPPRPPTWHALDVPDVLSALGSGSRGLGQQEVERRLLQFGPNRLPEEPRTPAWLRFARQFANLLIYVLLIAAVVTAALGDWIETFVILAVIVINAVIGYVQEGRAEAALDSLRSMLALRAVALRDDHRVDVDAETLVPGDVVLIESGDRVPADLRILEAHNLRAEEAALTGESLPVEKRRAAVAEGAGIGDRASILHAGTTITTGAGVGVVIATGAATEVGRIGEMVSRVVTLKTPFLTAIDRFSRVLAYFILIAGAALFAFGTLVRGIAVDEAFLIVIGFAVAAIPEGLPAVITIILALGVQRLAARRAIIRRLPAVETLGSVTVICSDKTGTLTRNEMTVRRIVTRLGDHEVSGEGYEPVGDVTMAGVNLNDAPLVRALAAAAAATADAEFRIEGGKRTLSGDPTDASMVVLAEKLAVQGGERIDRLPFESDSRYAAALVRAGDSTAIHVKGAPERVLAMCSQELQADGGLGALGASEREHWLAAAHALAGGAYRVLAVASKRVSDEVTTLHPFDAEQGLVLLGLVALIDPPREGVAESVARCRRAGIRVVMITGDHARTASAIAASLGIGDGVSVVTGAELEGLGEAALDRVVAESDVFARASPEHKLRLLEALQRKGAVAAMTGDGVNDAPALKRAAVGIAMGVKGSEAAKDASEMVLADDDFTTIARAVEEGRAIYDNLKKTILFILPTNGAEALVVMASIVAVMEAMPITAVQILWINMVTAVTLALALAFEPPEANVMRRPPRAANEPILSRYLLWRVGYVSVLMGAATLGVFFAVLGSSGDLALARTAAVNALVAAEIGYLFNTRFLLAKPFGGRRSWSNPAVFVSIGVLVALQMLFTYLPGMQRAFGVVALDAAGWGLALAVGFGVFVAVEIEKAIVRRSSGVG
jgi:magnesium-transporting ATPase (P-type)